MANRLFSNFFSFQTGNIQPREQCKSPPQLAAPLIPYRARKLAQAFLAG